MRLWESSGGDVDEAEAVQSLAMVATKQRVAAVVPILGNMPVCSDRTWS
jgi:hypothetical protein